jgi:MFS family permease
MGKKTSGGRSRMSQDSGAAQAPEPLTHRQALGVVAAVLPTVFMSSLDQTIVASALPTIGHAFGATEHLSWVASAYLLTLTATTPLFGKLSDIHGRRLALRWGLLLFMAGGAASALAPNLAALIFARAVQGIGAAGLTSQALTILGDVAAPKERARYYTYYSLVYTTAGGVGPALGGWFAEHVHWSLAFCATTPLGFVSLIWCERVLRALPTQRRSHTLDVQGAALIIAASSTCMFVISAGGKTFSWTSWEIMFAAAFSACAWVAFALRQSRAREPLIPPHLLRSSIVRTAIGASACGWGAVIGLNIYLPLYLQAMHGLSPAESGVQMIAFMVMVNLGALMGSSAAARMDRYKLYPIATNIICVAGMAWLALHADAISPMAFQLVLLCVGLGFGPMAPVVTVAVQNSVPPSDLGAATSTLSFGRGLFAAVLVAALGAVALEPAAAALSAGADAQTQTAAISAFRLLFWMTTASFALGLACFIAMEERPLRSGQGGKA